MSNDVSDDLNAQISQTRRRIAGMNDKTISESGTSRIDDNISAHSGSSGGSAKKRGMKSHIALKQKSAAIRRAGKYRVFST